MLGKRVDVVEVTLMSLFIVDPDTSHIHAYHLADIALMLPPFQTVCLYKRSPSPCAPDTCHALTPAEAFPSSVFWAR